jgi:tetratricopeptide (TPR) repeat protein
MRGTWVWIVVFIATILGGCVAGGGPASRRGEIDQVPMYGGMDRQSVPQLKQADEQLIAGTTKAFGSREKASDAFVDQGIRYYASNNYVMAMRRFNQAWLLNPNNPDVFWGFGMIFHDKGNVCEAKNMIDRAISLKLSKPSALADAGRIYTLCGAGNQSLDFATKRRYFTTSEELYQKASSISPNNDYICGSWATAYYWRGDYARSWQMVAKARSVGFVFPGAFIALLQKKMPEPSSK